MSHHLALGIIIKVSNSVKQTLFVNNGVRISEADLSVAKDVTSGDIRVIRHVLRLMISVMVGLR